MRRFLLLMIGALVLGLTATFAPITAAGADTASDPDFQADAKAAGLSATEAENLQRRVDKYLTEHGGKQVAANKIEYGTGGTLLLSLPGERFARELDEPVAVTTTCDYGFFCAWSGTNFTGDKRSEYYCSELISIPWSGTGSWRNEQTRGTVARFLNGARNEIDRSTAPGYKFSYSWSPVFFIDIC
ncbi:hypothetical protein GCM10009677_27100 [Sphaerisporangium rubeum]|uniref:Peptidase inhibitor family I36 protein n=1 Tax=Sphaerisporangium rubeum TaxID=321317 RepID=A0A7X0IFD0_9ACTN|nr:hypothetical protein [Sphaerisporangium rubeum]MBB6472647.1 hypothetical protein [Sphaerisporangium rubeum]